ncbi:broad-complex core protein isoforms 1/2/3/4/5 isoform X2 [Aedes albopictus]|uniref:BTB domain-containing protein n=1 Tax=Aedes albopictus TaxID=7160 RepID=A0ABM1YG54_AEDAL|nr:broad-complex core protein isoforms 1/2/3/4/5-like isoform X2 [Aedes albopictus]
MDEFALCWNNFADNIASGFQKLYDLGDLVDVTIACDGKLLKAHKIVLAICSPYFQEMFMSNPCKHPIIVLKDVSVNVMQELLQFMYQGEVNVKHSELQCFMKIAETLQIKGLTASHKNERSPTPSSGLTPAPAHRASSTSQLDPSKLNSYLAAAAKESLKRAAESTPEAFPGLHYPIKKSIKRSTDSIDQDSNSDCMDNLSSDEAFIPASPQISMIEQSPSAVAPSARQFDLSNVKREAGGDSVSSPQQSPTNLATSAAAMGAAAAAASAAAAMKLGFSSTPTSASAAAAALHPMFGGFDHNNSSFSGIATSLASISGNGSGNNGAVAIAGGTPGGPGGSAGGLKLASMDYSTDYGSDYGKGGIPPGHMDIPAVAPGEKWFQGRLQFMLSQRGKPLLVHDGHSFGIQYIRKDKKYWQCNLSRKYNCKARVTTTDTGDIIVTNNEHCHTEIRQHLRKDYKSMKQLNASLAALRARHHEALNMGLVVPMGGSTTTADMSGLVASSNSNSSATLGLNNNGAIGGALSMVSSAQQSASQQQEQETSLNLSTSGNWQLKKEPTPSSNE